MKLSEISKPLIEGRIEKIETAPIPGTKFTVDLVQNFVSVDMVEFYADVYDSSDNKHKKKYGERIFVGSLRDTNITDLRAMAAEVGKKFAEQNAASYKLD